MNLIRDKEYWGSQERDPYMYVRERNQFWNKIGSTITQLAVTWLTFGIVKILIFLAFVFALIAGLSQ